MSVNANMRGFFKDLKFEQIAFEELSFLKDLANQELSILSLRDRLVEHDKNNPIPNAINSENIIKAHQYFPAYKKALLGILELIDRHIKPFETQYQKEQQEQQEKNKQQIAEKTLQQAKNNEKTLIKKQIEQGITSLFGEDEENTDELCCENNFDEIQLQKDSDI